MEQDNDQASDALRIPFAVRMREVVVVQYIFRHLGQGNPIYAQYCLEVGRAIIEQALADRMATGRQSGTTDEVQITIDAGDLWQQLARRGADVDNRLFSMLVPNDFVGYSAIVDIWQQVYEHRDPLMIGATAALVGHWALEGVFARQEVQEAFGILTANMD